MEKTKSKKNKTKKTSVKHIRIRLIGGCINDVANSKEAEHVCTAHHF